MATMVRAEQLLTALRLRGASSAADLAADLGVSQPTVSRLLASVGDVVARIGQARRSRYAAIRDVRGLGSRWPLFRIDAQGRPQEFGLLTALYPRGALVAPRRPTDWMRDEFSDGLFPGVPWFLDDQRPQGFLGRQFAQRWAGALGLPSDILLWDDDAVMTALLLRGSDGPGDFVLGERSLEAALAEGPSPIPTAERGEVYARFAEAAMGGAEVGSSAAGEQPKFTTAVADGNNETRHVIVKFSEPVDGNATARRWADLLLSEHIAGEVLRDHGHASARSDIVWSGGRACLEVTRFDRIGAYGRRGCVTLAAWSDAHDGVRDDGWAGAASRMRAGGWIDADTLERIRERWWFGRLIGNTDMHFGNLAFFLDDALPLELTPNYDMLPMMYRPAASGAVVGREFTVATPTPADLAVWSLASGWAVSFWQRVAEDAGISREFQAIANANAQIVTRARSRFAS